MAVENPEPLLEVTGLSVEFRTERGWTKVLDDVGFSLGRGRTLALVGESGSGKTVTSLAVMGLLPPRGSRLVGSVRLDGRELVGMPESKLIETRGRDIGMIFQEPRRSLNPAFTVGEQIAEVVRRHDGLSRKDAWSRAVEMLDAVQIPEAARRARHYPHEFSGGMCQRVMLAGALVCRPQLLIADEPTTALDVTVQARMLKLMNDLQADSDLSILFITHDLAVVSEMADDVAVMYAGQLVEQAPIDELLVRPQHPYTAGLLASSPDVQGTVERMRHIPGSVPAVGNWPSGCRFHPRCEYARGGQCDSDPAVLLQVGRGRLSRCLRTSELTLQGVQT
ncbi:ABC transporter ATP-binding protein [uncultured Modestobacter sp.]|uniref:ABC transporter ATP-binding protein n=1 Tax=uncultured Modestobacter sp. TaxID=380048 RepID=UPI002617D662|nr:ABC transporter ATP-binding protein [uncultured Modestobacter sp.]